MSFKGKNLSNAYSFWIGTLMFGLPLLSSFYIVQFSSYSLVKYLVPYVLISLIIGFFILSLRKKSWEIPTDLNLNRSIPNRRTGESFRLAYVSLSFATVAVFSYWAMKYFVAVVYPSPNSEYAGLTALVYLISLSLAVGSGMPFILGRIFPVIRNALAFDRNYTSIAVIIGIAYFITYLFLVNQIIVVGFNTPPGNFVPSPSGSYPFGFVFTAGPPPSSVVESVIYVPQILLQLNQFFSLIVLPFEVILATVLSSLVAATVVATLYIIRYSSAHSCITGATVSGLGGFFGFTATCPTCLVPTLVSVFFGGVSSTVPSIYSHLAGVVLPPLVSVVALTFGLGILNYQTREQGESLKSLESLLQRKAN